MVLVAGLVGTGSGAAPVVAPVVQTVATTTLNTTGAADSQAVISEAAVSGL
jgi:hypothetical protein